MTMARITIFVGCVMLTAAAATAAPARSKGGAAKPVPPMPTVTTPTGMAATTPGATASATTPAPAPAPTGSSSTPGGPATRSAAEDSAMTLRAGQDGTVFRSLTVEGEDRIHFEFERPELKLDLDPSKAPGLDWGSARDVLDRTVPDLASPLVARSALQASPGVAHPWLGHFASGDVARFRPDVKGVERWTLTIVDARGETVASYSGRGTPPREIVWDGRSKSGAPIVPGLTYSYVFEAHDRAGNKRNFVGQGFRVAAYRLDTAEGPVMVFSGRELPLPDPTRPSSASARDVAPIVIEAATWINQSAKSAGPVRVTATGRTFEEAQALASLVVRQMAPHLVGDPARLQAVTEVRPDAPERGAVRIAAAR
jgi:hypothetical protein